MLDNYTLIPLGWVIIYINALLFFFYKSAITQSNAYGMKESGPSSSDMNAWTSAGLQSTAGYYPYDPALAAYG